MAGELAGGAGAGEAFAAGGAAAIDDGATILGGHAGEEAELADAALLGRLKRSFHESLEGNGQDTETEVDDKRILTTSAISASVL